MQDVQVVHFIQIVRVVKEITVMQVMQFNKVMCVLQEILFTRWVALMIQLDVRVRTPRKFVGGLGGLVGCGG